MRKQLKNLVLPLLAIVLAGMAGAQSTTTAAPKRAALLKVNVVRGEDGINLEMAVRGQVMPSVSTLDTPARIVVDLPDTVATRCKYAARPLWCGRRFQRYRLLPRRRLLL